MRIHTLQLGVLGANCYILENEGKCLAIDIGGSFTRFSDFLGEHSLKPDAILLTHGHFDHIAGVQAAVAKYNCPVYIHEDDADMLTDSEKNLAASCGIRINLVTEAEVHLLHEGDKVKLAGLELQIMHTPGHSPGSICILCENNLFTGDTLFCESVGRTDFAGSSTIKMRESLQRLATVEGNPAVYPGHGEATSLEMEKQFNAYFI